MHYLIFNKNKSSERNNFPKYKIYFLILNFKTTRGKNVEEISPT